MKGGVNDTFNADVEAMQKSLPLRCTARCVPNHAQHAAAAGGHQPQCIDEHMSHHVMISSLENKAAAHTEKLQAA